MALVVVAAVSDRGESMAGLLEHCDRREAVLATDIKYTQTRCARLRHFLFFAPLYLFVDASKVFLSEHQSKISNLLCSRQRKVEILTIEKLEQENKNFLKSATKKKQLLIDCG